MQTTLSLRRLLRRKDARALLARLHVLLPGVAVRLVDADGELFVGNGVGNFAPAVPVFSLPLSVGEMKVGQLEAQGPGVPEQPMIRATLNFVQQVCNQLLVSRQESRSLADETLERYREINLLYNIGHSISGCLDPEAIPHLVLEEAARVIETDLGGVLLLDEEGALRPTANLGDSELADLLLESSQEGLARLFRYRESQIRTADQMQAPPPGLSSILCVPLKAQERMLGMVMLGRKEGREIFTAGDQKLLTALAGQAAIAMENARLFADVKEQRDAIAEMKSYMDNIFASIASGVITTDVADLVTILNRAAEQILEVDATDLMGQCYKDVLPALGGAIEPLVADVKRSDEAVFGYEMQPVLPQRGPVNLRLHLSPLKNNHRETTGIAIVVDDLTRQKQLEAQVRQVRQTFERYVSPQVVADLLSDPAKVKLGGERCEVSVLFADVRGFTSFSEYLEPEVAVEVLNEHLAVAASAVLAENGTLDKFMGDGMMAFFNAPLEQPDHALRALRAAWQMQRAIDAFHIDLPEERIMHFGIGVVTGSAVVGNVGSPELQNYTAIGSSINLAARLQTYAGPGQILLDSDAYRLVQNYVTVRELGEVSLKGYREPRMVFEILNVTT